MKSPAQSITDTGHPRWYRGRIPSPAGRERWAWAGLALFWNAIAQPMFWLILFNQPQLEWWKLALVGLFPLIGFGLLYTAAVKALQWKRFGNLELVMDPFPGSLGGDVGGEIEIPVPYRAGKSVEVVLSCIRVTISRGNRNNRRSETVLWREHAVVDVEPGMRGSRIRFAFPVPAGQPASGDPSDDYVAWMVHVHRKLPGADLDQTFEIPVLDTGEPLRSRRLHTASTTSAGNVELPADTVVMERGAEGLRLRYPASRTRGMGLAMLLFGVVFGIVPAFVITQFSGFSDTAFGMVFIVFGAFFVLVFGLIGLLLLLFGVYSLFNSLEVTVNSQGIETIRRFLGFSFRDSLASTDISQLSYRINAQQGHGARAKVHFVLEALSGAGKRLCLGDGIKGKPLANRLMKELGATLGHTRWTEQTGSRLRRRRR